MLDSFLGQIILFFLLFFYVSIWRDLRCQDLATLKFFQLSMTAILVEKPFKGEIYQCGKIYHF